MTAKMSSSTTAVTIPSPSPASISEEATLARDLLDLILREGLAGSGGGAVREVLTELRQSRPELRVEEPKLVEAPYKLHRQLWLTQLRGILENWKEHYLEKDADLWILAERLAARLLLEMHGGWPPEMEDLRQALFAHWCRLMLPPLALWEQGDRATRGGRWYDFEA
jgi:hypothetical protein